MIMHRRLLPFIVVSRRHVLSISKRGERLYFNPAKGGRGRLLSKSIKLTRSRREASLRSIDILIWCLVELLEEDLDVPEFEVSDIIWSGQASSSRNKS